MVDYPVPYKTDSIYFSYNVKDYKKAVQFYTEVLGFEKGWDGGEEVGWVEFALPMEGAKLGLNIQKEGKIEQGSGVVVLEVHDLDKTKNYFDSKNVKTTDIIDIPDMVSYFNIYDIDGNRLQAVSDPRVKSE